MKQPHTLTRRPTRKRPFLAAAAAAVAILGLAACSSSQGEPEKPAESAVEAAGSQDAGTKPEVEQVEELTVEALKIIVPANPGGGWDQTGRALQQALQESGLVGSVQVVNVGGAGGTVGLAQLATEQDPNTLMVTGLVMVGAVETNKSENRIEDTTPIAKLTEEPLIVVVPASSPYQTITDLVDDMVENGRDVSVAGGSAGGADNILAGQLLEAAGVPKDQIQEKLNYIAYSGGAESVTAMLGNKVSAGISGVGEYAEQVAAGKLRALAVSGPERSSSVPDVPTLVESGYDVELTNWRGVLAPGSIDEKTATALVDAIVQLHETQEWADVLETNNWDDAFLSGQEFTDFLTEDIASVSQTLADLGLVD